jgi:putative PEP-CTERM system histidine kinase
MSQFGTVSYSAAAAGFVVLFLLLLTSWRGRVLGMLLASATLVTALWAATLAYGAARAEAGTSLSPALDVLRSALWFAFLLVLLGYSRKAVRALRIAAVAIGAVCLGLLVAALLQGATTPSTFELFSRLLLAVVGMVLVEQLYRNVQPQQRATIILLCLGLGAIFVCDFYLYSDALLFRRINEDIWAARGFVDALVVPLLAVATSRNPRWSVDIFVSREVVFHSAAVLGAAGYLLVMAAAGYYVRYFGGTWGTALQIVFVFAALQVLVLMLFSGTLRARLKVFLSKNFFSHRYDYREEWLRFTRVLSEGEPGRLRERSIQAIANLVHSPAGALWLRHDTGVFEPAALWNMPASNATEAADGEFCSFLEKRQWVLNLDDGADEPAATEPLKIPDWLRSMPRAWLVVPLILQERLLGFVVLARSLGRMSLNWEVHDLLKTAGRQAASYLGQVEAAQALLVARQFESFNRMSAFVVHDLKNLVAQLSLLLSNWEKHRHNPEFQDDMIETVSHAVDRMKRLLFQLRSYTVEPPAPVELDALLRDAVAAKSDRTPRPRLEADSGPLSIVAHRARLERIVGHLIQNAVEATPRDGDVTVRLSRQGDAAVITVADTGCGMSEQFQRNHLFRPFESSKPSGMGIGTYEVQQYVRELGGRVEVESREGKGSVFRLILPHPQLAPDAAPVLRYATEDPR